MRRLLHTGSKDVSWKRAKKLKGARDKRQESTKQTNTHQGQTRGKITRLFERFRQVMKHEKEGGYKGSKEVEKKELEKKKKRKARLLFLIHSSSAFVQCSFFPSRMP